MGKRVFIAALTASTFLFAQTPTASVLGTVQDSTGGLIAGATVKIRNSGSGEMREILSDGRGEFTAAQLTPGRYDIFIEKSGFRGLRETGIELQVDQSARLRFQLEIGSVSESVNVTADAPLINTENATKGEVITSLEMTEMPLN